MFWMDLISLEYELTKIGHNFRKETVSKIEGSIHVFNTTFSVGELYNNTGWTVKWC